FALPIAASERSTGSALGLGRCARCGAAPRRRRCLRTAVCRQPRACVTASVPEAYQPRPPHHASRCVAPPRSTPASISDGNSQLRGAWAARTVFTALACPECATLGAQRSSGGSPPFANGPHRLGRVSRQPTDGGGWGCHQGNRCTIVCTAGLPAEDACFLL